MVPEPAQVDTLHHLAQLQMEDTQAVDYPRCGDYNFALCVRCAWIYSEENDGRLKNIKRYHNNIKTPILT